jgi:hypothetical protein
MEGRQPKESLMFQLLYYRIFVRQAPIEHVPGPGGLSCLVCDLRFDDSAEQRAHFKLDWHRGNVRRKLRGVEPGGNGPTGPGFLVGATEKCIFLKFFPTQNVRGPTDTVNFGVIFNNSSVHKMHVGMGRKGRMFWLRQLPSKRQ